MKKIERIINGLIIGSTFPLLFGLLSVISWFYLDGAEHKVIIYLVIGLFIGLLIDLKFLKNWINVRFDLPIWFIIAIYVIYNILVYGFFMGLPLFNIFLGLFAGYYFGNRIYYKNILNEKQSKIINQVSLFTGLIMTLICISTGFIALTDESVGAAIKGMLGLNFNITKSMVWGIVLIGGFSLILSQILLTSFTIMKTIKFNTCKRDFHTRSI